MEYRESFNKRIHVIIDNILKVIKSKSCVDDSVPLLIQNIKNLKDLEYPSLKEVSESDLYVPCEDNKQRVLLENIFIPYSPTRSELLKALNSNNIYYVDQLLQKTRKELKDLEYFKCFGWGCLSIILKKHNLKLANG